MVPPSRPPARAGYDTVPPNAGCDSRRTDFLGVSEHEPPDAVQEPRAAFHAVIVPVEVLFGRRGKQREEAGGVGAEGPDEIVRIHDVALRLRHLRAILDDHAL